jgi:aldose 1-epimerase
MEVFGQLADGRAVERYRLENADGVAVDILTLGGVIQRFHAPDREGRLADVALGYAGLDAYLDNPSHLGCIIGRCANRIAGGEVEIDGRTYALPRNRGRDTLHGGGVGFHRAVWTVESASASRLHLRHVSPEGDQGLPGVVTVEALYSLGDDGGLRLDFEAATTAPTIFNPTQHAYWNLAGDGVGDMLDHRLTVHADAFTPMSERMVPTGEIRRVDGGPLDFRRPARLGDRVDRTDEPQIKLAGGVDHNFVLAMGPTPELRPAALLEDPASGRTLEVLTTEPGLQVYTANFLGGDLPGKSGRPYGKRQGVALETQHFPDAPHHPNFPSILLRPGEVFRSSTVFRTGVALP